MESAYTTISSYITRLEEAAAELGVEGLRWNVFAGRLHLRVRPPALLPSYLSVEPLRADRTWLANSETLGVVHVTDAEEAQAELEPEARELLKQLIPHLLEAAPEGLADALKAWDVRTTPVGAIDRIALVAKGFCRVESVFLDERPEVRAAAVSRAPWIGPALDDGEALTAHARELAPDDRMAICAATAEDGQRFRVVDGRLAAGGRITPEDLAEYGQLRNIPLCCLEAFDTSLLGLPYRREHVAWLDSLRRGPRTAAGPLTVFSPLENFLAARLYHLLFFDYRPCSPGCEATHARNLCALETLYSDDDAADVAQMLTTSFVLWPDGRLVPFRCTGVTGDVVGVADLGRVRWADRMAPKIREQVRTGLPGLERPEAVDALRWTGSRWEVRQDARWTRLRERGRWFRTIQPQVALYDGALPGR
jgi:hypothetical protein